MTEYAIYYNKKLIDVIDAETKEDALNIAQCSIDIKRNKAGGN